MSVIKYFLDTIVDAIKFFIENGYNFFWICVGFTLYKYIGKVTEIKLKWKDFELSIKKLAERLDKAISSTKLQKSPDSKEMESSMEMSLVEDEEFLAELKEIRDDLYKLSKQ